MPKLSSKPLTEAQIKSVKLISEQTNKSLQIMSEPLRQMNESIAKTFNSALFLQLKSITEQFSKIPIIDFKEIFAQTKFPTIDFYPPTVREVAPIITRADYLMDRQDELLESLTEIAQANLNNKQYSYYSETETFLIDLHLPGAIYLGAKNGNNSMKVLFEIFYEALEESGEVKNGYNIVFVSVEEIFTKAVQKGKKEVDMDWLKHTRSNLVNTKIPNFLKQIVIISEYDKNKKGYFFKVRTDE